MSKSNKNKSSKSIKYSKSSKSIKSKSSKNKSSKSSKNTSSSYSPTINQDLITLKSVSRNELLDCNIEDAFNLKEPLQIGIPETTKCYLYSSSEAIRFLLKNLSANKHINPNEIITPIQIDSNCWFNAFFVTFFVSDKGRKFFHFLRQLMIEGKQVDGTLIPSKLWDAFALLNFGIEACLTGNEYAYELNTNNIIHKIYKGIPKSYSITDVHEAGNPLMYYNTIINYLHANTSIQMRFISGANTKWNEKLSDELPHIIVLEIYDNHTQFNDHKSLSFNINNAKYQLDSAVIRDTTEQHFCATITCNKKEMGYDGMSFHRLVPLKWKQLLNKDANWSFKDTGADLVWNFTKCYQLLMYYRIK